MVNYSLKSILFLTLCFNLILLLSCRNQKIYDQEILLYINKGNDDSLLKYIRLEISNKHFNQKSLIAACNYLHQKNKDKEALEIIDIIESTNSTAELLSLKASIYVDQGKSKEAINIYNALITKIDTSLRLRLGRAIANADLKKYQEAINDLTYIINKQPSSKIYNYRAEMKYGLSDIRGTFDDYKKSAEKGDSIAILNIQGMYKKYPEAKNW